VAINDRYKFVLMFYMQSLLEALEEERDFEPKATNRLTFKPLSEPRLQTGCPIRYQLGNISEATENFSIT
jgi:hypothetical protein